MSGPYYQRVAGTNSDGSPIFATAADKRSEGEVAQRLLALFQRASIIQMPSLCPIDWLVARDGRIIAVAELKTRSAVHDPVWINLRKWTALHIAALALTSSPRHPVMPLYLVRFPDRLLAVDLRTVRDPQPHMGGTSRFVKSSNDIELVIDISLSLMWPVPTEGATAA